MKDVNTKQKYQLYSPSWGSYLTLCQEVEPTERERSLGVTTAALICAAPLTQQCFSPTLISSAAAADLCRVVQPSFHIPLRMFTLEHPQIDPRCASAHFINPHQHHSRLTLGSPEAPTQDSVRLRQSDCVLLEATEPPHLSATDMHSIDELRQAVIYAISYWLYVCVTVDLKLKKGISFYFPGVFVVKRPVVADSELDMRAAERNTLLRVMTQHCSVWPQ